MRLRMAAASLAGLTLLAAATAVTGPAVAGTTRAAGPAVTVAAESGYIDTEPGGRVYDSEGGTPSVTEVSDGQYVVEFPNLSDLTDKGGNFEVTPVQTAHNCTITAFDTGTGGTAIVYVDCYLLGSLTDTYFDLTATRPAPSSTDCSTTPGSRTRTSPTSSPARTCSTPRTRPAG